MKKIINTKNAPRAIGPYSQGVRVEKATAKDMYFFSGQIPLEADTGKIVAGGVVEQTKQVLKNIDVLLVSEGLTRTSVVKATVFLKDFNDFAAVNSEYAKFFETDPPARSCVEVSRLPLDVLIEIEVIAIG